MHATFEWFDIRPSSAGRAVRAFSTAAALGWLAACAPMPSAAPGSSGYGGAMDASSMDANRLIASLLPADAVLLGERHDAPGQPERVLEVVQVLVNRRQLAALVLEMAPAGTTSVAVGKDATEAAVQKALAWNERAWPWARYAPSVMTAVRAGVPVLGGNLPDDRVRAAMADVSLDAQLETTARAAQQQAIRDGHCGLLPEKQIAPMTRVQIARDRSMAHTVAESVVPGRTVVLWSGTGHADRAVGVPQLLPTGLTVRTVRMQAQSDEATAADTADAADSSVAAHFDRVWLTPAMPPRDDCAELKTRFAPKKS